MSATLMYVGMGAILATGVGIFAIAILFLQTARRYVDLTEKRLELLREGETFLLKIVQRQGRALEESLQREAEQRESVPEMVGYVIGRQQGEESLGNRPRNRPREDPRPRGARERRRPSAKEEEQKQKEKTGEAAPRQGNDAPFLGVQVPHPDDDVPGRGWNKSPVRFFQKCYDRYLEHYEGYVRLAARLHSTGDEACNDALGRRDWDDKLRRAYDAIERTTQRLDVLEAHYPELATDSDRISSRIGTARLHADLTERFSRPR
jgi:hypothetical protein